MASGQVDLLAVLETLGDVAFTVDADARYDLVTEALAAFHGTEPETLAGEESLLFDHLRNDERWTEFQALVAGEREQLRLELTVDDPDREWTVLDTRLTRHTVGGEFHSVVVVGWDVTAQKRRRQALEALHDVTNSIQTADTVEDVCELAVTAAADILEFTMCTVLIREGEWLVPYATSDDSPVDTSQRMRIDQGGAGRTYRTGTTQVADDFGDDPDADPVKSSYRSGLSIPVGDHGIFQAVSTETAAFDETDVELAELLVSHAESAIDRIEREKVVTALHEVATTIQTEDTIEGVCQRTVTAAETILDFDNCIVFLPDGDRMTVVAMSEEFPAEEIESLPMEGSIAGKTYQTGETYNVGGASDHPVANPQGPYESGLSVPIGEHGVCQVISTEPDAFDEQDREFVELLISHTESAIDRIERERELEELTTRFELALEGTNTGVWEWDLETGEQFWDSRAERLYGYEPGESPETYEAFTEQVHPEDIARMERNHERYLTEGFPPDYGFDFRIVEDGETERWLFARAEVFSEDGEPRRMLGIVTDITERKERERDLRRLKEEYESVFENVRDSLFLVDVDGHEDPQFRLRRLNPTNADLMGVDPEAVRGKPPTEVFGEEAGAEIVANYRRCLELGESISYEEELSLPEDRRIFETTLTPVEVDGEITRIVGVAHDITERKERERELRMYEAIVEAVDDGVLVINDDRRVELANQSYVDMKGIDRSDVLGTAVTELGDDQDVDQITERVEELRRGERDMVKAEYDFQRVDGESFPVELRLTPLVFPDGEWGWVGTFRDISERKRYEQRLEQRADQLETLNRIVRHDISNDMTVVIEMTKAVRKRLEDPQLESHLDHALSAARHTVELTRTARDLMQTMLAEERERRPVPLRAVLESELSDLESSTDATIRVDGDIPGVNVLADDLLSSVFRNLLSNAVQHNDKPDPEVVVSAEAFDGYVRVRVADNGPGIPDDRKEAIFGKGERGLDSEGTGVGLYLVQTLVDNYDGAIRVEDRDGDDGSIFIVELERDSPDDSPWTR